MTEPTLNGFLQSSEVTADQSWSLLDWLLRAGADEFSVETLRVDGIESPALAWFHRELEPFSLGRLPRQDPSSSSRSLTPVWRLNSDTQRILREAFPEGLLEYSDVEDEGGWIEDPRVYRAGNLVLWVTTHEDVALLQLPLDEYHQLSSDLEVVLHSEWPPAPPR